MEKRVSVLGMGNPLLDIMGCGDEGMMKEFDLKPNNFIFAESRHAALYEKLKNSSDVLYVAGGATQNSVRVCQAMLGVPFSTAYTGCIGMDSDGGELRRLLEREGVRDLYVESKKNATGICGVVVLEKERSLVTSLGAANDYDIAYIQSEAFQSVLNQSAFVYSSGFFLTVCFEGMKLAAQSCMRRGANYCVNLAAPFIVEHFKEQLLSILGYSSFVFGNESEFAQLGEVMGWAPSGKGSEELRKIAGSLAELPKASEFERIVVCTQGADSVIIASSTQQVHLFDVPPVHKDLIVDTNGAGDAFVGGFLYALCKIHTQNPKEIKSLSKDNLQSCVKAANHAAQHIIQRSGCTFDVQTLRI